MVVVSSAVRCCSTVAEENRTIGWECEGSGGTGGVGWAFLCAHVRFCCVTCFR